MSAWVLGLALAAGYLINKKIAVRTRLDEAVAKYDNAAKPSTGGATTAEVKNAWRNTDFTRFGDMSEELAQAQKVQIDQKVRDQQAVVQEYDASGAPPIQGVLLTYDRLGC